MAAMKASGNLPPPQTEELTSLWEHIHMLSEIRENKLKESLALVSRLYMQIVVCRQIVEHCGAVVKHWTLD